MFTSRRQLPHMRGFSARTCASDNVGLGVRGISSSRTATTAGILSLFTSTDMPVLPARTGMGAANDGEKHPSGLELDGCVVEKRSAGVEEGECRSIPCVVSVDIGIVEWRRVNALASLPWMTGSDRKCTELSD